MQNTQLKETSMKLIVITSILVALGLLVAYTSTAASSYQRFGSSFVFLKKQAIGVFLGICAGLFVYKIPIAAIKRSTVLVTLVSLVLLSVVMIPGVGMTIGGATRWISLGGFSLQPSEIAKLAMVLFLAKNLSRLNHDSTDFKTGLLPNFVVLGLFIMLLLFQKDLGTTVVLITVTFVCLFATRMKRKHILGYAAAGLTLFVLAVITTPYRIRRLMTFTDPWADATGDGYQLIQSLVAFINGGIWGLGLGESKQKLFYLPHASSDFVFAVIGEEFGVIGSVVIIALFFYFAFLCIKIMSFQKDDFSRLFILAYLSLVVSQAFLNIGVAIGLLPTKGIALPFISTGANALIVFIFGAGIVLKIALQNTHENDPNISPSLQN